MYLSDIKSILLLHPAEVTYKTAYLAAEIANQHSEYEAIESN